MQHEKTLVFKCRINNANVFAPQITNAGSDVVSVQKTGATTWALTNANSYTGATTITGGSLQLGDGTIGNDGTIANTSGVTNNATLAFNRFGSSTAGYPITGTGAVTKLGAGTQTLSGLSAIAANNYSGSTTIDNGTLAFTTTNPALTGGLVFGLAAGAITTGGLDLSASSASFGSLTAQTNFATANTITIGNGKTLQINGAVTVGTTSGSTTTKLTATGQGSLSIGTNTVPTDASVAIGAGTGNNSGNNGTLDLSGLSTFYANLGIGTFRVGSPTNSGGGGGGAGSTAILAGNSTIQATNLTVGGQDSGATHYLRLGDGTNLLNADTITVGTSGRSGANISFNGANGSVTVRGSTGGTSRANLTLVSTSFGTAGSVFGTFDTTNHNADLMLGTMNVGVRSGSSGTGSATGTLNFNQGTLDVNDLLAGSVTNGASTGSATGNVNLSGGTATFNSSTNALRLGSNLDESRTATGSLNISGTANVSVAANGGNSIVLGNATVAGGTANGVLNLTGGTLTVAGDIVRGATTGTSNATITLGGGTLDMGGNDIGSGGGAVTLTAESGTLKNVASINGTGGLTKTTADTLTLDGTNTYTGNTVVSDGTLALADNAQLKFVLGNSSGSNNGISGTGTLTLDGDFNIDTTAADGLATGSWTLVDNTTLAETYTTNFTVAGFSPVGSTKWEKTIPGNKKYTFDEATGILTLGASASYASWIDGFFTGETDLAIIGPDADPDNDGLDNGVEMVVGGNPATGMDSVLMPTIELVNADPDGDTNFSDYLLFTYRRTAVSETSGVTAACETDFDLVAPWTTAVNGTADVVILTDTPTFTPSAPPDTDRVRVYVPRGANTKIFGRLNVQVP